MTTTRCRAPDVRPLWLVLTAAIGGSSQAADSGIRPNVRYGTARALVGLFSWFRDGGIEPRPRCWARHWTTTYTRRCISSSSFVLLINIARNDEVFATVFGRLLQFDKHRRSVGAVNWTATRLLGERYYHRKPQGARIQWSGDTPHHQLVYK